MNYLKFIAIFGFLFLNQSHADIELYQGGNIVNPPVNNKVFGGTVTIKRQNPPFVANCNLTIAVDIDVLAGPVMQMDITGAALNGPFPCGLLALAGLPSTSISLQADLQPINNIDFAGAFVVAPGITFPNISEITFCGALANTIISYDNMDAGGNVLNSALSTLTFNNAPLGALCTINGTLTVQDKDIDIVRTIKDKD